MATLADLLTSKIPPHSLEAERAVLGGMLLDRESLPKAVELLKPADFYKEGHRKIFDATLALFERNEPVDLLTVSEELKRRATLEEVGGAAALAALTGINLVGVRAGGAVQCAFMAAKIAPIRRSAPSLDRRLSGTRPTFHPAGVSPHKPIAAF